MLQVTNNNTFDLSDRYDGQDFTFPAGSTVALGEDAARHIFGFGEADKTPFLARQGWVRNSGEIEAGMAKLSGFSFSSMDIPMQGEVIVQEDEEPPKVEKSPPAQRGTPGKSILDKLSASA